MVGEDRTEDSGCSLRVLQVVECVLERAFGFTHIPFRQQVGFIGLRVLGFRLRARGFLGFEESCGRKRTEP